MDKNTNNRLLFIATFIMALMSAVMFYQNKTLGKYKEILNNVDTTAVVIQHDTVYTDIDSTITQPIIIKETILRVDTLYNNDGDTIEVKKKTRLIPIQ